MHMDGRLIIGNRRLETPEKITSINPSNLEAVGEACLASSEESQKAILSAKEALALWQSLPLGEKKGVFKKAKKILLQRSSEVAHIITLEKGSPFTESLSVEVLEGLEALDYYASALKKTLRTKKAKHHVSFFSNKKSSFRFEPFGVMLVISPWNFPFLIPFYDILSALTAGNTVVFRPSTSTPFVALLVEDHIKDAASKGARILWGGNRIKSTPGYFIEPSVLANVNHSMKIMKEETFGPVLPIMSFSEPNEALSLANDCRYGLTASIWTKDKKLAKWMAERIEAGSVTINDHMFSFVEPGAIWGGIKQTGIGRSHGDFGLLGLANIKYVSLDFIKKKSQLWWYPYDASLTKILEKSLILFHHDRLIKKLKPCSLSYPIGQGLKKEVRFKI